jgi:hypothetical protein
MRMISIRGILIASFVIGFAITGVFAQQMPLGPGSGYSGPVGMAPPPIAGSYPGSMCAPPLPPMKIRPSGPAPCFPSPNAGYDCPPPTCMPGTYIEPSVFVGYLYKDHGAGVNIQFGNGDVLGITSARNDFTLQGVWLELAAPVALSQNVGLFLSVAHLFPVQTIALESYQLTDDAAKREWNPDIQWWELDTALTCRLTPALTGIAGFRWSSFMVNFGQATNQVNFSTSPDQAQLTANAYIPLLGLALQCEPTCNSSFKAAFLGFPALPGDIDFQETLTPTGTDSTRFSGPTNYRSGYFYEALAEASTRMGAWSLGALVRFDAIHTNRTRDFTLDGASRSADVLFDRRNWIFGGKIGCIF